MHLASRARQNLTVHTYPHTWSCGLSRSGMVCATMGCRPRMSMKQAGEVASTKSRSSRTWVRGREGVCSHTGSPPGGAWGLMRWWQRVRQSVTQGLKQAVVREQYALPRSHVELWNACRSTASLFSNPHSIATALKYVWHGFPRFYPPVLLPLPLPPQPPPSFSHPLLPPAAMEQRSDMTRTTTPSTSPSRM